MSRKPEQVLPMTQEGRAALSSWNSLYAFFRNFWYVLNTDTLVDNWHLREVCDFTQAYLTAVIHQRRIPDGHINVPPGSSKSTIASQMGPAWLWLHAPWARVITSSFESSLSIGHAIKSKQLIDSEQYRAWFGPLFEPVHGRALAFVKETEKHVVNNFGGERRATSTGGSITGRHAHLIIRDDPMDPYKAESDAYRKQEERFNDRTLANRKTNMLLTPTLTIMQRVHEKDTTARDLSKAIPLNHMCLPATLNENVKPARMREKYEQGYLDPNRLGPQALAKARATLGSYGYAGQYDMSPTPLGGGIFKKHWFPRYNKAAIQYRMMHQTYTVDTSLTKNEKDNSPNGILGGVKIGHDLYLFGWRKFWAEFPELVKALPAFMQMHGARPSSIMAIEPKSNGKSVVQQLKRSLPINVIEDVNPDVDKVSRAKAITPYCEAARIWVPAGEPWVDEFLEDLATFVPGQSKEAVDCLVMMVNRLIVPQSAGESRAGY